ncbi:hypothetical protein ACLOJK_038534 [Asimina triloba]
MPQSKSGKCCYRSRWVPLLRSDLRSDETADADRNPDRFPPSIWGQRMSPSPIGDDATCVLPRHRWTLLLPASTMLVATSSKTSDHSVVSGRQ